MISRKSCLIYYDHLNFFYYIHSLRQSNKHILYMKKSSLLNRDQQLVKLYISLGHQSRYNRYVLKLPLRNDNDMG
jgi:hypothetical protein